MEKKIKELEKILKYNFKKSSLLEKALTHKSLDNNINNEISRILSSAHNLNPAIYRGQRTTSYYSLPVKINLN